jgi:hypothetical protein
MRLSGLWSSAIFVDVGGAICDEDGYIVSISPVSILSSELFRPHDAQGFGCVRLPTRELQCPDCTQKLEFILVLS